MQRVGESSLRLLHFGAGVSGESHTQATRMRVTSQLSAGAKVRHPPRRLSTVIVLFLWRGPVGSGPARHSVCFDLGGLHWSALGRLTITHEAAGAATGQCKNPS